MLVPVALCRRFSVLRLQFLMLRRGIHNLLRLLTMMVLPASRSPCRVKHGLERYSGSLLLQLLLVLFLPPPLIIQLIDALFEPIVDRCDFRMVLAEKILGHFQLRVDVHFSRLGLLRRSGRLRLRDLVIHEDLLA